MSEVIQRFGTPVISVLIYGILIVTNTDDSFAANVPLSADEVRPLLIGAKAPCLTVRTTEGETVNIHEFLSRKPTVLVFYRGGWCIYCNTHLRELRGIESELIDLGYQIVAISPDKPEKLKASMSDNELKYRLLSDSRMEAAASFGIAFKVDEPTINKYREYGIDLVDASGESHHMLPVPSVFLIDVDATIYFVYVNPNYQVRLSSDVLRAAAKTMLNK